MNRVIFHCDINHFYAGVEELFNPQTRNKPMAVGGDKEKRHGIILAKNPHAKKYGVKTGEPLWQAKEKCPDLIILPARFSLYLRFSQYIFKIYERYTDKIEAFGIDEAWLDVSESMLLYDDPMTLAKRIASDIYREYGLTISIGISFNKIFAKLGSDYKKPSGITLISKNMVSSIVYPLPVGELLYVGRATTKRLARYGIYTIGELANSDPLLLKRHLGKIGTMLWHFANGDDVSPVNPSSVHSLIKSVGNSITTKTDMKTMEDVKIVATVLSESVAARLRQHGFACRCVSVSIRDETLHGFTRQKVLDTTTNISTEICAAAMDLFKENIASTTILRSIGIKAEHLVSDDTPSQTSLFIPFIDRIKEHKVDCVMDDIRKRFGFHAISRASLAINPILSDFNPKQDHVIFPISFLKAQ